VLQEKRERPFDALARLDRREGLCYRLLAVVALFEVRRMGQRQLAKLADSAELTADKTFSAIPGGLAASNADSLRMPSRLGEAVADFAAGMARSWIWTRLAYQDIKERYRGSVLGPFWVTLTNLIMICALGTIYSELFHMTPAKYVPYIATGILTWQFISGMITEGCTTFTAAHDVISQVPMPFSVQAYRVVYRNLLVLAHNAVLIPFVLLIFSVPVDWRVLEVFPALLLLSLNGLWMTVLFGTVSTRFRDIPPIIANVVQVLFFVTPIFWPLEAVASLQKVLALNPFFAWIDVVRAPLLGYAPQPTSWPLLLGCVVAGWAVSFLFFVRFRERIAYWV
jgi:ABC-type polysaccharide/polyol phosphate export permease